MKVYQTYCNSDMTEGRGPMIPGPAFLHLTHAQKYIDNQPGVMGRRFKWSEEDYGDWEIKEIEVHEFCLIEAQKQKEITKANALKKLTPQEREALGL